MPIYLTEYICRRLEEYGTTTLFLGSHCSPEKLNFEFPKDGTSPHRLVKTKSPLNLGYAADAYARLNGFGCIVSATLEDFSGVQNCIAGSASEHVRVFHVVSNDDAPDRTIKGCAECTSARYVDCRHLGEAAASAIDDCFKLMQLKSCPVTVRISADQVVDTYRTLPVHTFPSVDHACIEFLHKAIVNPKTVIIPGQLIARFKLQEVFKHIMMRYGRQYLTLMLGKGVISETSDCYLGTFVGAASKPAVLEALQQAERIILVGEFASDLNCFGMPHLFPSEKLIQLDGQSLVFQNQVVYQNAHIDPVLRQLSVMDHAQEPSQKAYHRETPRVEVEAKPLRSKPTYDILTDKLGSDSNGIMIVDTGSFLFDVFASEIPLNCIVIHQAFYASIGYSIGATLGACLASPSSTVYTLVGDGAFQMTCQDMDHPCLSRVEMFLFNNDGYLIERVIAGGDYNDISPWNYTQFVESCCPRFRTFACRTYAELHEALSDSSASNKFIELHLPRYDCSAGLKSMGIKIAQSNKLPPANLPAVD